MSTGTTIYAEYKNRSTGEWSLLHMYGLANPDRMSDEGQTDRDLVEINGARYNLITNDYYQGWIRDFFNEEDVGRSGLPADLSPMLKSVFKKAEEREKDSIIKNYGATEENWRKYARHRHESCVSLAELEALAEGKRTECMKKIFDFHTRIVTGETNRRLDFIISRLDGKDVKKLMRKTEDEYELQRDLDYALDDELKEYDWILAFCAHITWMVEFVTYSYPNKEDIRLIFYTS